MSNVVVDLGSGVLKAGFIGHETPMVKIASLIGHNSETGVASFGDTALYEESLQKPGKSPFSIHHIVNERERDTRSIVRKAPDGIDVNLILEHIFKEFLNTSPDLSSLLLTGSDETLKQSHIVTGIIELFKPKSFFMLPQSSCALFSRGRTCGSVVNIGEWRTTLDATFEGFVLHRLKHQINSGAASLRSTLRTHLLDNGVLKTSHGRAELPRYDQHIILHDIQENLCSLKMSDVDEAREYILPDGRKMMLEQEETFNLPRDHFNSTVIPSLNLAGDYKDEDKQMMDAIQEPKTLLCGGLATIPGCEDHVQMYDTDVPGDPGTAAFLGASIVGGLSSFHEMFISMNDYESHGSSYVHRKCIFNN
eukprot:GHVH01001580.1.p1 GENE.GHVH01001580.1~~GHVH01001580.1.p1  ORF type:complete len:376 (+),score=47.24 GHVH01001580.1:39-1130(+)